MKIVLVFVTFSISAFAQKYVPTVADVERGVAHARELAAREGRGPGFSLPGEECTKKEIDPFVIQLVNYLRNGSALNHSRSYHGWGLVKKVKKSDSSEVFRQDLVACRDVDGKIHYFDLNVGSCAPGVIPGNFIREVTIDADSDFNFVHWQGPPLDTSRLRKRQIQRMEQQPRPSRAPSSKP